MYFYEFIFVTIVLHVLATNFSSIDAALSVFGGISFSITLNNTSSDDFKVKVMPGDFTEETSGNITDQACKCVPAGQTKTIRIKSAIQSPSREDQCCIYVLIGPYSQNNAKEIIKIIFHIYLLEGNSRVEILTIHCDNINTGALNSSQLTECAKTHGQDGNYDRDTLKTCPNVSVFEDTNEKDAIVVNDLLTAHAMVKRDVRKNEVSKPLSSSDYESNKVLHETVLTYATGVPDIVKTKDVCPQPTEKNEQMKHKKVIHLNNSSLDQSFHKYLNQYRWVVAVLAAITIIQCFLIFIICIRRKWQCFGEKKIISHFFRTYQQDSVTTPLISSAIDIENSKNECTYESSTTLSNTKRYKAFEKDNSQNTKISRSDDILSKFINRREWKNQYKNNPENEISNGVEQVARVHLKHKNDDARISKDNGSIENRSAVASELVNYDNNNKKEDMNSSDREGQYHSFSCYNTQVDSGSTFDKKDLVTNESKSSSKAAQTYFSKDSIDAILSQRHIYLADENLSKYTLSSASGKNKSTELLNKASNNVVKYFNTLLQKRSRQTSQSEPEKDKDLKLLHISNGSLYSSNDSE